MWLESGAEGRLAPDSRRSMGELDGAPFSSFVAAGHHVQVLCPVVLRCIYSTFQECEEMG